VTTVNVTSAPTTASRVLRWNSVGYVPAHVANDSSVPRRFTGWADPTNEGITPQTGDTWERGGNEPIPFILDTDLSTDVDDALDVKACVTYHIDGAIDLLGVACTTSRDKSPGAARAIGNAYGYAVPVASYAPIGTFNPGTNANYIDDLYDDFDHAGVGLAASEDSTTVGYRTWLASAADGSVSILMTGFAKALRHALESAADGISALDGNDLFALKCDRIYAVAGIWPTNAPASAEFNLAQNAADWNWLIANCPVPITFVGIEIGNAIGTVGGTYLTDRLPAGDITVTALDAWNTQHSIGATRTAWGLAGAYAAVEGREHGAFTTVTGTATINSSTGANSFSAGAGDHEYLVRVSPAAWLRSQHQSLVAATGQAGTVTWNGSAWA
jgi:hypothetical protein